MLLNNGFYLTLSICPKMSSENLIEKWIEKLHHKPNIINLMLYYNIKQKTLRYNMYLVNNLYLIAKIIKKNILVIYYY